MRKVRYEDIRDAIKSGDRLEFAGSGIVGRLIRLFTKTVNHTASCLSIDEYSNYVGNRKFILEADSPGIVLNTISRTLQGYKGRVFYTPLLAVYDDRRACMADWALQQVGRKYDFKGLFANIFGRINADARRMICSEYHFLMLVIGRLVAGVVMNNKGCAVDHEGRPVKAPRPGEFDRFPVYGETLEIIIPS